MLFWFQEYPDSLERTWGMSTLWKIFLILMSDLGKQLEIIPEVEAKLKKDRRVREGSKCEISEFINIL